MTAERFLSPTTEPERARILQEVTELVLREATAGDDAPGLLSAMCERLVGAGIPLWRVSVGMRALDPTVRAFSVAWRRGQGVTADQTQHSEGEAQYRRSPVSYLYDHGVTQQRWSLEKSGGWEAYPMLRDMRAQGATDYKIQILRFGGPTAAAMPGVAVAIATDRRGGFTDPEIAQFEAVLPALGLACLRFALSRTAGDLLGVYLGSMTAGRVLAGEAQRGTGRAITAAILLADLRDFTALTAREDPLRVVSWLDEHLEAVGAPVAEEGGEVLKFLGDGLLAVFPVVEGERTDAAACASALRAAEEALARTQALNALRREQGAPQLGLDVVLHFGEVVYGNVGASRRLDFTVIGRAVNEASRIEGLCRQLGRSLLLSAPFAERCGRRTRSLGRFALRGIDGEREVAALA